MPNKLNFDRLGSQAYILCLFEQLPPAASAAPGSEAAVLLTQVPAVAVWIGMSLHCRDCQRSETVPGQKKKLKKTLIKRKQSNKKQTHKLLTNSPVGFFSLHSEPQSYLG